MVAAWMRSLTVQVSRRAKERVKPHERAGKELELTAPIFNIQSYSNSRRAGHSCYRFCKRLPLLPLPVVRKPESNLSQPQLMTYLSKCVGCGACLQACPQGAICMEPGDGKMRAVTDRARCTDCGACEEVCPHAAREYCRETHDRP
jgi:pyruvate formate lyase activating enzyme